MSKGTRNKAQRALATLRGKGKAAGPWPLCDRGLERLALIDQDFRRENQTIQLRAQSRADEVLALLRPEAAPKGAVYDRDQEAFVLPPAGEEGGAGTQVPPKTAEQLAADAAFEAERAKARDAMQADDEEKGSAGPEPPWTE